MRKERQITLTPEVVILAKYLLAMDGWQKITEADKEKLVAYMKTRTLMDLKQIKPLITNKDVSSLQSQRTHQRNILLQRGLPYSLVSKADNIAGYLSSALQQTPLSTHYQVDQIYQHLLQEMEK